jgi:lipoate-protein ligase A
MSTNRQIQAERWKPDESAAAAYLRADKIIIHGSCVTTIGDLACEPCLAISAAVADTELGAALLQVLAAAKIAEPPRDLKIEGQKILATAGARSWKQFTDSGVYCYVGMTPQQIAILPTRKERQAFFHVPEQAIKLSVGSTPEECGKSLREGFSRCT